VYRAARFVENIRHSLARVDRRFVEYIRGAYSQSRAFIQLGRQYSRALSVFNRCTIGRPVVAAFLFNLVIDPGLPAIPDAVVGYSISNAKVNAPALADDVILVVSTPRGGRGVTRVARNVHGTIEF